MVRRFLTPEYVLLQLRGYAGLETRGTESGVWLETPDYHRFVVSRHGLPETTK